MQSQESFFPCPSCREIIGTSATKCRYCNSEIDTQTAIASATFQNEINQACNDASMVRNVAGVMWVAFVVQFLFAAMGRLAFFGMMIAVPVMLIRWQIKYGRIKTDDIDFKLARRNRTIALLLWLPTPFVIVAAIVMFAASS